MENNWHINLINLSTENFVFSISFSDYWYLLVNGEKHKKKLYSVRIKQYGWYGFYCVIGFFSVGIGYRSK